MAMQNQDIGNTLAAFAPNARVSIRERLSSADLCAFNSSEYAVIPGFCDVHVHFREPGFSYRRPSKQEALLLHGAATPLCAPCPI